AERLQRLGVEDYLQMPWNCHPTNVENLWMLPARKARRSNGAAVSDQEEIQQLPRRSFLVPKIKGSVRTELVSELRSLLKQRLPPYMQPSAFLVCESLPVSANGKIDHAALLQLPIAADGED